MTNQTKSTTSSSAADAAAATFERNSLIQMLTDVPHVKNDEIIAALDAGLTRDDIEWNQRLDRPWLFRATNADEETAARAAYYAPALSLYEKKA